MECPKFRIHIVKGHILHLSFKKKNKWEYFRILKKKNKEKNFLDVLNMLHKSRSY